MNRDRLLYRSLLTLRTAVRVMTSLVALCERWKTMR